MRSAIMEQNDPGAVCARASIKIRTRRNGVD